MCSELEPPPPRKTGKAALLIALARLLQVLTIYRRFIYLRADRFLHTEKAVLSFDCVFLHIVCYDKYDIFVFPCRWFLFFFSPRKDRGGEYRSLLGIPGGLSGAMAGPIKEEAAKRGLALREGAGGDPDTLMRNTVSTQAFVSSLLLLRMSLLRFCVCCACGMCCGGFLFLFREVL